MRLFKRIVFWFVFIVFMAFVTIICEKLGIGDQAFLKLVYKGSAFITASWALYPFLVKGEWR